MEAIILNSVISRRTDIAVADMDGEVVMMSLENGKYYNLGKLGTVIWEMIENPISAETVISMLLEKYEVTREQCETEVMAFLNEMNKQGLLETI